MISPLITVRDVPTSMAFYVDQLGFTVSAILPNPAGEPVFATIEYNNGMMSLDNTEHAGLPQNARLGLGVDLFIELNADVSVDELYGKLNRAGVTIVQPPKDEFWGDRRLIVEDPDGYRLSLYKTVRTVSVEDMATFTQQPTA